MQARGITLGVATFFRSRPPEPFAADDVLLAEELVARAAVCVDNARRYTRERDRGPDPAAQPAAAASCPAGRAWRSPPATCPPDAPSGVGGDWFDVIPLSGARVALVVGDVVGHGIHASATMGRLRTAVRTLADVDLPPDELLTHLDDLVIRPGRDAGPTARTPADPSLPATFGATCLYAVYDPVSRRCTLAARRPSRRRWSSAPDGAVRLPGPARRAAARPRRRCPSSRSSSTLPEGSLLALYTDGLIEARDRDIDDGLRRLRERPGQPGAPLEELCDTVLRDAAARPAVRRRRPAPRPHPRPGRATRSPPGTLPADPAVVASARKLADRAAGRLGPGGGGVRHRTGRQRTGHQRHPLRHRPDPAAADPGRRADLRGLRRQQHRPASAPGPHLRRGRPRACSWSRSSPSAGAPAHTDRQDHLGRAEHAVRRRRLRRGGLSPERPRTGRTPERGAVR